MAKMQEEDLRVTLGNKTPYPISLQKSHVWKGSHILFPKTILPNGSGTVIDFMDTGSKVFGVYIGRNPSGLDCAWLCAWDAPIKDVTSTPPNKVFVICGTEERILSLTEDQIEILLDNSKSSSTFADTVTKTCADANIHSAIPTPNPTVQNTSISANFGLIP